MYNVSEFIKESIEMKKSVKDCGKDPMPEIRDPVFAKTSPKRSFLMSENELFGLVFVKTEFINLGTGYSSKWILSISYANSRGQYCIRDFSLLNIPSKFVRLNILNYCSGFLHDHNI
jgi:hypothetical protein